MPRLSPSALLIFALLAGCAELDREITLPKLSPAPIDRIQASSLPMSRDVWRVSVKSDGQIEKEIVERAALYRAAELTLQRGFERFIVQSTAVGSQQRQITQTLTQTTEFVGSASNVVVPGVGSLLGGGASAVISGIDRAFTAYGGEIIVRMFKADDPAAVNALDADEILNTYVNELRRPK